MSVKAGVAELFVRAKVPTALALKTKGGRETAQRISKDFSAFIDGIAEGYGVEPADGLRKILDGDFTFEQLVKEHPMDVQTAMNGFVHNWGNIKGFRDGWRYMKPVFARSFVYHVLPMTRPELAKVLVEHPKGEEWMVGCVATLRKLLWNK